MTFDDGVVYLFVGPGLAIVVVGFKHDHFILPLLSFVLSRIDPFPWAV